MFVLPQMLWSQGPRVGGYWKSCFVGSLCLRGLLGPYLMLTQLLEKMLVAPIPIVLGVRVSSSGVKTTKLEGTWGHRLAVEYKYATEYHVTALSS